MAINRADLPHTDLSDIVTDDRIAATRPGDVLRHDFMEPLGLSAYALAKATGVPSNRITAVLHGTRSITADTAIRLGRYFGTTAELWMNLQSKYDLAVARGELADA